MDAHLRFHGFSGKRLHLGVCGSVAAYRAAELVHLWRDAGVGVSATLTRGARGFVSPLTFEALGASPVYTDMFAGQTPFEHLEPGQVAQALVIAPASADMLARLVQGRADEMLCCQALAFDGPVLVAPAMNPRMWQNPATRDNVAVLRERGVFFVGPEQGVVACGDEGPGRFADLRAIYLAGLKAVTPQDMEGQTVLITLGPTREAWDDVRFWSNGSSGIMGASLAVGAWLRGARVHAVCGPVDVWLPDDDLFHRHNVRTAAQMLEKSRALWPDAQLGIFVAAVADFRPEAHGPGKFKKSLAQNGFSLRFLPTEDILRLLAAERSPRQKVAGFAAESAEDAEALAHAARRKLLDKGADLVVGNKLADGFARSGNRVFVADRYGREEHWPEMPNPDVAWKILTWLLAL